MIHVTQSVYNTIKETHPHIIHHYTTKNITIPHSNHHICYVPKGK